MDDEGFIKIVDRSKDLVKSGGEWISSVDLENTLMGHPAVKEAAVVGVPHPKWQERPLAAVVLKEDATATPQELRDFLAKSFATPSANSKKSLYANNSLTGIGTPERESLFLTNIPNQLSEIEHRTLTRIDRACVTEIS